MVSRADAGPIRVLVVDDSALMRKVISDLLASDPRLVVAGIARDGEEAIRQAAALKPDVVTLDVEMPGLSGIDTIPALLAVHEVPIVMVSSYTHEGAEPTLTALERGAVDFLPKPDRNQIAQLRAARDLLVNKVLLAAQSRIRRSRPPGGSGSYPVIRRPAGPEARLPSRALEGPARCVVLGISTGGPQTLTQVLSAVKGPLPPLLIVQHMPSQFTKVFAGRLDRHCRAIVKEAEEGDRVLPDRVLVAPGSHHLTLTGHPSHVRVRLSADPPISGHRPSVDVLFQSAAKMYGSGVVGLIMTGMGRDGVEGCRQILAAGGRAYGQDEASSIVYGMNKAAWEEKVLTDQFSVDDLPRFLERLHEAEPGH
jgi:two-component system chemotaxis response regulator CheB